MNSKNVCFDLFDKSEKKGCFDLFAFYFCFFLLFAFCLLSRTPWRASGPEDRRPMVRPASPHQLPSGPARAIDAATTQVVDHERPHGRSTATRRPKRTVAALVRFGWSLERTFSTLCACGLWRSRPTKLGIFGGCTRRLSLTVLQAAPAPFLEIL